MSDRELKAELAGERARAKAMRPWYRKKRFILPIGLFGLFLAIAAIGSMAEEDDEPPFDPGGVERVPASRVDSQREDQEVAIGQSVQLSGYTTTVTAATFQQSLSQFEGDGYLVADVTVLNRDDAAQPYSPTDWRLQTPQGQVIDTSFTVGVEQLGFGDLVQGGSVSGQVVWKIGAERGRFMIIYKPDPFDAARGIWPMSVG